MANPKQKRIMRFSRIIRGCGLPALLTAVLCAVSCAEDIELTKADTGKYEAAGEAYGYLRNATATAERLVDLYKNEEKAERKVEVGLTRPLARAVDLHIAVDRSVLEAYNYENNRQFEMFPAEGVTLSRSTVTIPPGYTSIDPVTVTVRPAEGLTDGVTYVIPLRITSTDEDVVLSERQDRYLFFVTDRGDRLSAEKKAGYKVLSCMETGDADPRIHCELFLRNEGKPLVDMVVLFSAGLNYNAGNGQVYIYTNSSVSAIVNNRDRYIKPLQDMGIKVLLGLIGNRDAAGVSTMQEATAKRFVATQLKPFIEEYGLDGVFWDDEYTVSDPSIPGFSRGTQEDASRLIYEFKRAMPDKLNVVFAYGTIGSLGAVDGFLSGEYVDYMVSNYGVSMSAWPGGTTRQCMPYPYEFAQGTQGSPGKITSGNFGGIMVFALSEHRANWGSQLGGLGGIAKTMFNDELYYTGVSYPLEW